MVDAAPKRAYGTLIVAGLGASEPFEALLESLEGVPERLIFVEPADTPGGSYARRFSDLDGVTLIDAVVAESVGATELTSDNLISTRMIVAAQLLDVLDHLPAPVCLRIDMPGQEAVILQGLEDCGALDRIEILWMRCGAGVMFEGAQSRAGLQSWLEAHHFKLEQADEDDPEWPELRFKADQASRRIARLEATLGETRGSLAAAQAEARKQSGRALELEGRLSKAKAARTALEAKLTQARVAAEAEASNLRCTLSQRGEMIRALKVSLREAEARANAQQSACKKLRERLHAREELLARRRFVEEQGQQSLTVALETLHETRRRQMEYDPKALGTPTSSDKLPHVPIVKPRKFLLGPSRLSWIFPRLKVILSATQAAALTRVLPLIDATLSSADVIEAIDALYERLEGQELVLSMLLLAAHFMRTGDSLQALGLIAEGVELSGSSDQGLKTLAASLYLDLHRPQLALSALASDLTRPNVLSKDARRVLGELLAGLKPAGKDDEHGQDLLIKWLHEFPPMPLKRRRQMIEVGTTRENVPGQDSTRKLALLCAELGIQFVTVDMDASNSRRARRMFHRLDMPFEAVTGKGEIYLAEHPGPIDYVFLDAYDFDHGKHSELRQSRYETYLGDRINDAACHQMHLDCARALIRNLSPDGLICLDDSWIDDAGDWTAKGTTAVPFLLENGFEVIESRNRAVLLRRSAVA